MESSLAGTRRRNSKEQRAENREQVAPSDVQSCPEASLASEPNALCFPARGKRVKFRLPHLTVDLAFGTHTAAASIVQPTSGGRIVFQCDVEPRTHSSPDDIQTLPAIELLIVHFQHSVLPYRHNSYCSVYLGILPRRRSSLCCRTVFTRFDAPQRPQPGHDITASLLERAGIDRG